MNCYLIDCTDRQILLWSAAMTISEIGLVIRKSVQVGQVALIEHLKLDAPLLLIGSYQAQSSCGFVNVLAYSAPTIPIAGGIGFGWGFEGDRRGDALRVFSVPEKAFLLEEGACISPVPGRGCSNPAIADAAMAGLRMRQRLSGDIIIAEGQSDYVSGIQISGRNVIHLSEFSGEIPEEHRTDMFCYGGFMKAYHRSMTRDDLERYCEFLKADPMNVWNEGGLVCDMLVSGLSRSETDQELLRMRIEEACEEALNLFPVPSE